MHALERAHHGPETFPRAEARDRSRGRRNPRRTARVGLGQLLPGISDGDDGAVELPRTCRTLSSFPPNSPMTKRCSPFRRRCWREHGKGRRNQGRGGPAAGHRSNRLADAGSVRLSEAQTVCPERCLEDRIRAGLIEHSLPAIIEVETEHVSPLELVLRSLGKWVDRRSSRNCQAKTSCGTGHTSVSWYGHVFV